MCGILSIIAYLEGERINDRLEGIGANDAYEANEFALLIVSVLPLILPFIFRGKKKEKIVCFFFLPFILNAFILCNSRGAAIAIFAGLLYATFIIADRLLRKKIIIAAICVFPLFLYLTDSAYITRIQSLLNTGDAMEEQEELNTLSSGRTEIWRYGFQMVKDYPFGAGPNNFKKLARFYMPPEILSYKPDAEHGTRAAHNTYLQIMVEQGYLGLMLWITLCVHTLLILKRSSSKLYRSGMSNTFLGHTAYGLNVSFICALIGGLTMSRVYYEFFWWQVAFSVVAYSLLTESEVSERT
jgi:O-antigen ligase